MNVEVSGDLKDKTILTLSPSDSKVKISRVRGVSATVEAGEGSTLHAGGHGVNGGHLSDEHFADSSLVLCETELRSEGLALDLGAGEGFSKNTKPEIRNKS